MVNSDLPEGPYEAADLVGRVELFLAIELLGNPSGVTGEGLYRFADWGGNLGVVVGPKVGPALPPPAAAACPCRSSADPLSLRCFRSGYGARSWSQLEWWATATKRHRQRVDPTLDSPPFATEPAERDAWLAAIRDAAKAGRARAASQQQNTSLEI